MHTPFLVWLFHCKKGSISDVSRLNTSRKKSEFKYLTNKVGIYKCSLQKLRSIINVLCYLCKADVFGRSLQSWWYRNARARFPPPFSSARAQVPPKYKTARAQPLLRCRNARGRRVRWSASQSLWPVGRRLLNAVPWRPPLPIHSYPINLRKENRLNDGSWLRRSVLFCFYWNMFFKLLVLSFAK